MSNLFEQVGALLLTLTIFLAGIFNPTLSESVSGMKISGTTTAAVVNVIDGDTIDVKMENIIDPVRVRYIGIDTPEPYAEGDPQCGSREASVRNRELVADKVVTVVPGVDAYDKYGRLLAYVYVDDLFVNQMLIAEGYARVMMIEPNTQYHSDFTKLYNNAHATKIGIWSECGK